MVAVTRIRRIVGEVLDPELPVVTLHDLGIVRDVRIGADGTVHVDLTPTFSGCPAMTQIGDDVRAVLAEAGWTAVNIQLVLAPAWSTDWITPDGRRKLAEHGVVPPGPAPPPGEVAVSLQPVPCPRCSSSSTRVVSAFGSTACMAQHACTTCGEPFSRFKAI